MSYFDGFMAPIQHPESAIYPGASPPPLIVIPSSFHKVRKRKLKPAWLTAARIYLEMKTAR